MWNRVLTATLAAACITLAVALFRGEVTRIVVTSQPALAIGDQQMAQQMSLPPTPAELMLDRRIDRVVFESNMTLQTAMANVAAATKSRIVVDWPELNALNITPETHLSAPIDAHNVTLRAAVRLILHAGSHTSLGVGADNDRIVVTTLEKLRKYQIAILYNVRDIVDAVKSQNSPCSGPEYAETMDSLETIIKAKVDPESWTGDGGDGSMDSIAGMLVIIQFPDNHRAIAALLTAIRECSRMAAPASVLVKTEPQISSDGNAN